MSLLLFGAVAAAVCDDDVQPFTWICRIVSSHAVRRRSQVDRDSIQFCFCCTCMYNYIRLFNLSKINIADESIKRANEQENSKPSNCDCIT